MAAQGARQRGADESLAEWVVNITSAAQDAFVEAYDRCRRQPCRDQPLSSWPAAGPAAWHGC